MYNTEKEQIRLRLSEILDWCGYINVFVGITDDGVRYLCSCHDRDPQTGYPQYTAVKTTLELIQEFKNGQRNLLSLFEESEEFAYVVDTDTEYYVGSPIKREDIDDCDLPLKCCMYENLNPMGREYWK